MYNLNLQKILVVKTEFFPKLKYFNAVVEKSNNKKEKGFQGFSYGGETFFFQCVKSKCFKNIFL